ncbi:MAG: porin [Burkholderiales bacterium]|nr:porin [Burkholderiales bacterium]
MQKKLIAVAVAGALAAPAAALAQSTVQVFGNMYMEYGFINQGANNIGGADRANPDVLQSPGSEIGFRGEEKLGGGMAAWFQCASTADIRGQGPQGFCSRNSAIGLKGSFGNFFVGLWDNPYKRSVIGRTGARATGAFGIDHLVSGGPGTLAVGGATQGAFQRRQQNSINYDTPNFGGFMGMFSVTSTNPSTGLAAAAANAKQRHVSAAGLYRQGPVAVGVGYVENKKAYTAGTFAGDEDSWHVNASYQLGSVKLGGGYFWLDSNVGAGQNVKVNNYHLGAEWKLAGPHNVHFGYTRVGDTKGTLGAVMGAGANARPAVNAAGNTGAKLWQVKYVHDLSKRTFTSVGYTHLKNDTNGDYNLGGLRVGAAGQVGSKNRGVVVNIGHRF